jgi:hypothetical protein
MRVYYLLTTLVSFGAFDLNMECYIDKIIVIFEVFTSYSLYISRGKVRR